MRRRGLARKGAIVLSAAAAIACEVGIGPPKVEPQVRVEPVTPTDLSAVEWALIEPTPTVRVIDLQGSPVGGIVVYFDIERGSGTVGQPVALSRADGTATVGSWRASSEGLWGLTVRAGESRVTFTAEVEAWRGIERVTGDGQTAAPNQGLPLHLVVLVTMDEGWPVSGAEVTYTVVSGGGSLEGASTVTDSDGHAESGTWTLGPDVGAQEVRAESGSASIVFVAYATEPSSLGETHDMPRTP